MNFPRFWARGQNGNCYCWRWSSRSRDEAQLLADQAAQQLADRFQAGDFPAKQGGYYPERPLREQVLQEIKNSAGAITAVVTRNSYGCLVLNTARVMFVDIDLPEPRLSGFFKRLFGKPGQISRDTQQAQALASIESWTQQHPGWGWRIYKTRAGLRLLATHDLLEADSGEAGNIFEALGADPLYRKLCRTQKCYRARLTPKPWRCGVRLKPERWPWLDANHEKRFHNWEAHYQSFAFNWATCELICQTGNSLVHPEIQPILDLHDKTARVGTTLPLA